MSQLQDPVYHTAIWAEEPEADNPFAARAARCHGYDVYGELLPRAGWFEYVLLLFRGERASAAEAALLERLAVAIAHPGVRDASVRAAMNGGVSKATHAATLMAAMAIGSGQYGGSEEVAACLRLWAVLDRDLPGWQAALARRETPERADIWLPLEHAPGFDPNGESCPMPVRQTLEVLAALSPGPALAWLREQRAVLEAAAGAPLAMTGVIAAAFRDLRLDEHQAAMLTLMLRLPGAAVQALEQRERGWRQFPFFGNHIHLANDPGRRDGGAS